MYEMYKFFVGRKKENIYFIFLIVIDVSRRYNKYFLENAFRFDEVKTSKFVRNFVKRWDINKQG